MIDFRVPLGQTELHAIEQIPLQRASRCAGSQKNLGKTKECRPPAGLLYRGLQVPYPANSTIRLPT